MRSRDKNNKSTATGNEGKGGRERNGEAGMGITRTQNQGMGGRKGKEWGGRGRKGETGTQQQDRCEWRKEKEWESRGDELGMAKAGNGGE